MKRLAGMVLILIALSAGANRGQEPAASDQQVVSEVETALVELKKAQTAIKGIHPFLAHSHPIAILEQEHLFIFEPDSLNEQYRFRKKAPLPFPMPSGIRAAFPLSVNEGKPTCIVSREIFDEAAGWVTIFHEFMHCQQSKICESKLKERLKIAQLAARANNYSWELNHEFPYQDPVFVEYYSRFLDALSENDRKTVGACRTHLKEYLSPVDFEYMVWQEWKEGFARLIENKILTEYDLALNHFGLDKPYGRIVFYAGGARFIDFLAAENEKLAVDIEKLFSRMQDYPGASR